MPKKPVPAEKRPKKRHAPDLDTANYSMAKVKGRTAEVLSPNARSRRQLFAVALIQHGYNGAAAARSIGIPRASASKQASEMRAEPYTQDCIAAVEAEWFGKDRTKLIQATERGLFREAHFEGLGSSHSARVSAFGTLGRWYGLDRRETGDPAAQSSGVMEIPMADSLEQWTQASTLSQAKLMEDVRK